MIITCSKLLTCTSHPQIINDGALAITKGKIQSVGPLRTIKKIFPHHRIIKLEHAVLMPGLVNLHSHLELPPLLEAIRAKSLVDWILNLISAKKKWNLRDYTRFVRDNINTIIRSGTTTVGEICTHGASPSLLKRSGLRGVIFHEIISMGPHNSKYKIEPAKLRYSNLLSAGISPHSPYTVSESALRAIASFSHRMNIRLAMHIAESRDELKLLQRKKSGLEKIYEFANWDVTWAPQGVSSFEYLGKIGILSTNLLAVHSVQVTDDDLRLIKISRMSIAHCPRSNRELGVGRMPLNKFLDAGITVGLGTDSLASVPTLNMWDEMRFAYRIHRRDGISVEDIFRIATIGGAKALGLDKNIGTFESGKKADIIAIPLPRINTGDLYSDLLRETKSCIMSIVDGKILYKMQ